MCNIKYTANALFLSSISIKLRTIAEQNTERIHLRELNQDFGFGVHRCKTNL